MKEIYHFKCGAIVEFDLPEGTKMKITDRVRFCKNRCNFYDEEIPLYKCPYHKKEYWK